MRRLVPLVSFITLVGCASWPTAKTASSIDARFRLQRSESRSGNSSESHGVRVYQKWLSQTLASHCRYFPSDSNYERIVARRCGPVKATFKSMARFLEEYDAPALNRPILTIGSKIYYEDIPGDCDWL